AWGFNGHGQLGDGFNNHYTPIQVGTDTHWASVTAGSEHTVAIKTDGTLWNWGDGESGQLGDGTFDDQGSPVQVGTATDWASAAAGFEHTVAVKTDGTLWAWGDDNYGQLGDGATFSNRRSPIQVGLGHQWVTVSAGGFYAVALAAS